MTFPSSVWEGNLQYITSSVTVTAEGGIPVQVDLDALSLDDDDNYEYTFQLTANTTIDVTFVVIPRYEIKVNSDCGEVILNGYWASDGEICLFKQGENVKLTLWGIGRDRSLKSLKVNETEVTDLYLAQGYYMIENLSADMEITVESEYADIYYIDHNNFNGTICLESTLTGQVNGGSEFIKGSSVTMTVKPAIGYEVAKIILFNEDGDVDITNDYKSNGNKYVLEDLSSDQYFVITTQKKTNSPSSVSFTLDESGMATFCSEYDLDFSSLSDISAYIAIGFSSETGKLMMQKVTEVQVGTGVLIVGKPGSYSIPTKQTSLYYHNMLKVVAEDQTISDIDWSDRYPYYNYVLANGKFNRVDDETPISAYQAYLQVTTNVALDTETISLEFVDMGDMNNDKKVTITDAVMILDQILTNQ
jgi:hypothetical protein